MKWGHSPDEEPHLGEPERGSEDHLPIQSTPPRYLLNDSGPTTRARAQRSGARARIRARNLMVFEHEHEHEHEHNQVDDPESLRSYPTGGVSERHSP